MKKTQRVWSQGDVVLLEEDLPKDAVEIMDHDGVLFYGEATGHSHRIPPNQARFFRSSKGLFFTALEDIHGLIHEDHPRGKRSIPKGTTLRYDQEREADWFSDVTRNVSD